MRFFVGTSGYSYKEWKGRFYPEKLPQKEMLGYYAQRLSTVEINNTFYRAPTVKLLASWASQVPAGFRFILKAPQKITHFKRLKEVEGDVDYFVSTSATLEDRLGPLLFQLPPNFKKDVPRLEALLGLLGKSAAAFEFRHESWHDEEVFAVLRKSGAALCASDTDEAPCTNPVSTAPWGYVRLRREAYDDRQLKDWIAKFRSLAWENAYVFFKHEDGGVGPKMAARFLELAQ